MEIAIISISIICLCVSIYFFIKSQKIKYKKLYDKQLDEQQTQIFNEKISELNNQYNKINDTIESLKKDRSEIQKDIQQTSRNAQINYDKQVKTYNNQLQSFKNSTLAASEQYFDNLDKLYQEKENEYNVKVIQLNNDYQATKTELNKLKSTLHAATEAQIRKQEIAANEKFYTLTLDVQSLYEIHIIEGIQDKLNDTRPLRMLIWTTYYSKKANEMCSRVLGTKKVTGIYKITSLTEDRCYIGQSVDIRERWREHMKCGLGIDTPAANKLYAAMSADGIENFTFELLEECSASELDEKEQYYIDLYDSYHYGYNSNTGIKRK